MLLSAQERLVLLQVLPNRGNVITLRVISELANRINFSKKERKRLQFEMLPNGVGMKWNTKADVPAEIRFDKEELKIIHDAFVALDQQKVLALEHLKVYDRFVLPAATKPALVPNKTKSA